MQGRDRIECRSQRLGAQERAASNPLRRRRAMAERPAGCARWSARIAPSAQGCAVGATGHRPRTLRARGAQGGAARGALLFGGFLLGEQEKATGPQGCGTNRHGRQSVFDKPNKPRQTHGQGASRLPNRRDAERTGTDANRFSTSRTDQGKHMAKAHAESPTAGLQDELIRTRVGLRTHAQGTTHVGVEPTPALTHPARACPRAVPRARPACPPAEQLRSSPVCRCRDGGTRVSRHAAPAA